MSQEIKNVSFSPEGLKELDGILKRYPDKRSALLPALYIAQREFGWISESVMVYVGGLLDLTPPKVFEVVTFYTMFNQKPVGKFHLQFCKTLSCALVGADDLIGYLQQKLGIRVGETTSDGMFTLKLVECLGSCGTAPVMQVNDAYYENLNREKLDRILDGLKKGDAPIPKAMGKN